MDKLKIILALTEPESANVLGRMIPVWAKKHDLVVIAQSDYGSNELAYEALQKRFTEGLLERYGVLNPLGFGQDDAIYFLNEKKPNFVITDTVAVTAGRVKDICYNIFCEAGAIGIPRIEVFPYPYITDHEVGLRIDEADTPEGVIAISSSVGYRIVDEFMDRKFVKSPPAPSNMDLVEIANNPKLDDYEIELRRVNGLDDKDNVLVYETSACRNETYAIDSAYYGALDAGFKVRWIFHTDEKEEIKEYCLRLADSAELTTKVDVYDEDGKLGYVQIAILQALTSMCRENRGAFASVESLSLYKLALISRMAQTNAITAFIGDNSTEPAALFGYSVKGKGIADFVQALTHIKDGQRNWNWVAPAPRGFFEKNLIERFDKAIEELWQEIKVKKHS